MTELDNCQAYEGSCKTFEKCIATSQVNSDKKVYLGTTDSSVRLIYLNGMKNYVERCKKLRCSKSAELEEIIKALND